MGAQGQPPTAPVFRTVAVGVNKDYPPFEYLDSTGEVAGWDVEMFREAARIAGIKAQFVHGSWAEIREQFERGEIDALAGMLWSEERAKSVEFTRAHMDVLYGIYVRGLDSGAALEDFKGRKILVEERSLVHEEMVRLGYADDLIPVESEPETLRRLAQGEGDCAIAPLLIGNEWNSHREPLG